MALCYIQKTHMENCEYSFSWHSKDKNWQIGSCLREKMATMSDPVKCTSYFSGIADDKCTIRKIQDICSSDTVKSFTVEDARSLCEAEHTASSRWWVDKIVSGKN